MEIFLLLMQGLAFYLALGETISNQEAIGAMIICSVLINKIKIEKIIRLIEGDKR